MGPQCTDCILCLRNYWWSRIQLSVGRGLVRAEMGHIGVTRLAWSLIGSGVHGSSLLFNNCGWIKDTDCIAPGCRIGAWTGWHSCCVRFLILNSRFYLRKISAEIIHFIQCYQLVFNLCTVANGQNFTVILQIKGILDGFSSFPPQVGNHGIMLPKTKNPSLATRPSQNMHTFKAW